MTAKGCKSLMEGSLIKYNARKNHVITIIIIWLVIHLIMNQGAVIKHYHPQNVYQLPSERQPKNNR